MKTAFPYHTHPHHLYQKLFFRNLQHRSENLLVPGVRVASKCPVLFWLGADKMIPVNDLALFKNTQISSKNNLFLCLIRLVSIRK